MGGSTLAQFLYQEYNQNLLQAITALVNNVLGVTATAIHAMLSIYVLILGKKMIGNAISFDQTVTKFVRAIVVVALMTPATFTTFVRDPIATTVPPLITQAVTGQQGLAGAQGFDALLNEVKHFSAATRAQAAGPLYFSERVIIWFAAGCARFIIICCDFIFNLASATVDFLIPIGALIIPFYLFDATRHFVERWYGKVLALFLVMFVNLALGQIVVVQDAAYMQKYAQNLATRAPPAEFRVNGYMNPEYGGLGPNDPLAGGNAGATTNVDVNIDVLWDLVNVFAYGLFLLLTVTGVALGIGAVSGFSAAPALAGATYIVSRTTRAASASGRAARAVVSRRR